MLKKQDVCFLKNAERSNGGGVDADLYSVASRERLLKLGFVAPKKGNVTSISLYVITKAGRAALNKHEREELHKAMEVVSTKATRFLEEKANAEVTRILTAPWEP